MKKIEYDLKHYQLADYEKIVYDFTAFFSKKYQKILSLYQFGNTSHPSVSDLDLAIVINDQAVNPEIIQNIVQDANTFVTANEHRRYIFEHGILIYFKQTFIQRDYIHITPNLYCLYGDEVERHKTLDTQELMHLHFIAYASNALKNFERVSEMESTGLKNVLKLFQNAYHQFKIIESNLDVEAFSSKIYQMRSFAINTKWDSELEQKLLLFYNEVDAKLIRAYDLQMDRLSYEVFGEKIEDSVYILENERLEKRHRLFIELAAVYAKIFKEEGNCYSMIHQNMFPLRKKSLTLSRPYERLIRKQAQALLPACRLYEKYGATQVLGPMMCYHCSPVISQKRKLIGMLQWLLFRLQGL